MTHPSRRPTTVVLARFLALALAVWVAGCSGGGSDERSIEATDGSRATDVESETTSVTSTSTSTSTTTSTTMTTTPPPPPPVSAEVCDAIGAYYTTAQTTDFIDPEDPFALQVTLIATRTGVDEVLRVGDGDPIIDPWVEVSRLLDVIDGLDAIDWDITRAAELPNGVEIGEALITLADEIDTTAPFLIAECDITQADIDRLDAGAESLAADIGSDPAAPTEAIEITDDTGRITMEVPGSWTDIVRSPQGAVSRLAAAPDFEAFDTTFAADGAFVLAVDVTDPEAWRQIFDEAVEGLSTDGCTLTEEVPYDDGVYRGAEGRFDCGVPGKTLDLFGGRDEDGSIAVVGQVVRPVGDTTTRDLVVESFLIS